MQKIKPQHNLTVFVKRNRIYFELLLNTKLRLQNMLCPILKEWLKQTYMMKIAAEKS